MRKEKLLEELGERGFLLSGSRYFNRKFGDELIPISERTDHDLYKQYKEGDDDMLSKLGFDLINQKLNINGVYVNDAKYPLDDLAVSIWEHEGSNIQVILRTDEELYSKVLSGISCEFYQTFLWKSSPIFVFEHKPSLSRTDLVMKIMNQLFTMKA
jgi:hypothetical protein